MARITKRVLNMSIAQSFTGPKSKPIRVSAKAIVMSGTDILLLKQPDGSWDLPGGKIRQGESVKTGLKREVREETGIDIAPKNLVRTTLASRRKGKEKLILSFLCQFDLHATSIRLSDEHVDFACMPLETALQLDLKPHHRSAVIAAHQHLS